MSITTKIQWCDSTCNPTMGCEGSELWNPKTGERACYAGALHLRYGGASKGYSPTFDEVTYWPGRMAAAAKWRDLTGASRPDKPWLDGLPRLIFVSDMSDALSAVVPFGFLEEEVIGNVTSTDGRRHHWLWLTKRPDRMAEFSALLRSKGVRWPENLWAGTSITTQPTTSRVKHLLRVGDESTIRFLSVEPQRGKLDLGAWLPRLDWVIQGGESGRGALPFHLEWAPDLIRQCQEAGVTFFLKQLGSAVFSKGQRLRFRDGHAGDWSEWPDEIRVRQMPRRITPMVRSPELCDSNGVEVLNGTRLSLEVVEGASKGRQAALKAWRTRKENERKKRRSEAAKKAWKTRRSNAENGVA
jgi:protein gp37